MNETYQYSSATPVYNIQSPQIGNELNVTQAQQHNMSVIDNWGKFKKLKKVPMAMMRRKSRHQTPILDSSNNFNQSRSRQRQAMLDSYNIGNVNQNNDTRV